MDIADKIKRMKIQGAINIAIASLRHLKKFAEKNGFGSAFDKECKRLLSTRPTGVALYNVMDELKKDRSMKKIDELLNKIKNNRERIACYGEKIIKNNSIVQTHCHSSGAIAIIKKAAEKKRFTVIVDVTEPRHQGIKTAKELSRIKNIDVVLITDDAAGLTFSNQCMPRTDIMILGADAIRKDGVVNKIGTYLLAVGAKERGIPFYIAASTLKYDRRNKLVIEMRNPGEVHKKISRVKILNPAFDITPWKYITAVITEDGIKKPAKILREMKK
jgi:ribose 1,5-bisphosphate isomerase